eukprot:159032-Pyramimonas_sp.AAC.1
MDSEGFPTEEYPAPPRNATQRNQVCTGSRVALRCVALRWGAGSGHTSEMFHHVGRKGALEDPV